MTKTVLWREVQLGEISRPKQWHTIKKSEMTETGYPVYGANGVIGRYHSFNHEDPTILIGCRGSCGIINVSEPKSYVTGNAMALDDLDVSQVDLQYLVYALEVDGLQDSVTGTSQPQITRTSLQRIRIPLPPIDDQRRIAALLDAADALRTKRRQAIAKLDTLTQAIFIDMFGDPLANDRGWPTMPFESLCPSQLGKMLDQKQQTGQHLRPYLRNTNVRWFGFDLDDIAKMDFDGKARAKYRLAPGDVLICEGGEPGRAAVWRGAIQECYFQKALHRGRPDPDLATSDFVVHLLARLADRGGLLDHISTATIAHLTGKRLKAMAVIAPPLEAQRRFGERVTEVAQQRKSFLASASDLDALFASLQQRAFRGDL